MSNKRKPRKPPAALQALEEAARTGNLEAVTVAPGTPCPDCSAVTAANASGQGQTLNHDDGCPLIGAVEAVCDADREWFRRHPDDDVRWRPTTRAERRGLAHAGRDPGPGLTEVSRTEWGRIRRFFPSAAAGSTGGVLDLDHRPGDGRE